MREIRIRDCLDCNHSVKRWRGRKVNCFHGKRWAGGSMDKCLIASSDFPIKVCPIPEWCPIFLQQNPPEFIGEGI